MTDRTTLTSQSIADPQPSPWPDAKYKGVRGWLFILCLMFVVIGPVISAWLMTYQYARFSPLFAGSRGLQGAILICVLVTACSVAYGVYAGLRLWLVRPKAVGTAKSALLFGLAADVVATTIELAVGQVSTANDRLLYRVEVSLVPSLIFFTLCFAYLNRSKRVHATYESHRTDA